VAGVMDNRAGMGQRGGVMRKGKVHFAGQLSGSNWRYLGCANPLSETAISVREDSDIITTDPAKVTCCHCRVKMQRGE